jgi:hypothetical protein
MDTEIDWRRELDGSFGVGPDVPVGHYVEEGRRAVRRRRVTAVVVAATLVVAGSTAWAASPGGGAPRGDAPVATTGPSPTQGELADERAERELRKQRLEQLREEAAEARIDFRGNPAALADHGLVLAPQTGAVLQRVPNPMEYTEEQGRSLAIRVMYEGRERYSLMTLVDNATSSSASTVDATGDFAGWLDGAVRSQRSIDVRNGVTPSSGDTSDGPWLALTPDGEVEASHPGTVLVEVRTDVDLGAGFSTGADQTGVVRLVVDGRSEFAAYRVIGGQLEVIPGGGSFDSLDSFVDWARGQYASGEGMR